MRNDPAMAGMFATLDQFAPPVRQRIVSLYGQSVAEQLPLIDSALAAGDRSAVKLLAHRIAGSAAMMQDANLAPRAKAVEAAAADGTVEVARAAFEAMRVAAMESIRALDAVYGAG